MIARSMVVSAAIVATLGVSAVGSAASAGPDRGQAASLIQRQVGSLGAVTQPPKTLPITTMLPPHLIDLGEKLFGSRGALEAAVRDSTVVSVNYIGAEFSLRMRVTDNAVGRLPAEGKADDYGLLKLQEAGLPVHGSLNVVDVGANYGVVPIALFKLFESVRAVIVEPIPMTFFFLKWNLWLNEVPEVAGETFTNNTHPGIFAINGGVAGETGKELSFCWQPDNSMNCVQCHCNKPPYPDSVCRTVTSVSTESLMAYFGKEGLDLLKMDCEGCEVNMLPALDKMDAHSGKVRRLVGELHIPPTNIEDLACRYNGTRDFMTRVCPDIGAGQPLECDGQRKKSCFAPLPFQP